ncbi:MAG: class I SAM-dependent methyltransferase [Actinomycetota bacterium]
MVAQRLEPHEDAYGAAMLAHHEGRPAFEIVERDDGSVHPGAGPDFYFAPFRRWRPDERQAMRFVRGRTLDIGCGAGRVLLHLGGREGVSASGIDISPLAVKVAKLRGARSVRIGSVEDLDANPGSFETLLLLGGNFGMLGGRSRAVRLLRRMGSSLANGGRLIASGRDARVTATRADLAYMRRNRSRGRMPGQFRIRIRYLNRCTPWFEQLTCSREEASKLLAGSGLGLVKFIPGPDGRFTIICEKNL